MPGYRANKNTDEGKIEEYTENSLDRFNSYDSNSPF